MPNNEHYEKRQKAACLCLLVAGRMGAFLARSICKNHNVWDYVSLCGNSSEQREKEHSDHTL